MGWYITYNLSYLDLRDVMDERGVGLPHTNIPGWGRRFALEFDSERLTYRLVSFLNLRYDR